jgi:hypothetical protein
LCSRAPGKLNYEIEATIGKEGVSYQIRNYYDSDGRRLDRPSEDRIDVSANAYRQSDLYTTYYGASYDRPKRTWCAFSTDAYHELVDSDSHSTTITWLLKGGKESNRRIKLWLVGPPAEKDILMNNQPSTIRVLNVAGDYEENQSNRPSSISDITPVHDPDYDGSWALNKFQILDSPDFPFSCLGGDLRVQSALPGRVVDAAGAPVARAKVSLGDVSATTWPDGRFSLPLLHQAFDKVEVTVTAEGYRLLRETRDLLEKDALPLNLTLTSTEGSRPDLIVIDNRNLAKLDSLDLKPPAKALIRDTIVARPNLAAVIPQGLLSEAAGSDVWYEIDTATGAAYARGSDGLYGSTGGGAIAGFGATLACLYLKAASVLDQEVATAINGSVGGDKTSAYGAAASPQEALRKAKTLALGLSGLTLGDPALQAGVGAAGNIADQAIETAAGAAGGTAGRVSFSRVADGCTPIGKQRQKPPIL